MMFERQFNLKISATVRPDYRRKLKSGEYPLRLFIYKEPGQRKSYPINICVTKKEWEKMSAKPMSSVGREKKVVIIEILAKSNDVIRELGDEFTFDIFEYKLFGKRPTKYDPADVFATYKAKIRNLEKNEQIGTAKAYLCSMRSLQKFRTKLTFYDLTVPFLKKYIKFMEKGKCGKTTIGINLRHLRAIVNIAKNNGIIDAVDYPFGKVYQNKIAIPTARNYKKALTVKEVRALQQYEPLPNEAWGRDMWLLSFYCNGMNMVDIFNLKWGQIKGDFVYFTREKTKNTAKEVRPVEVFLIQQAKEIIERWAVEGRRNKEKYVFGVFDEFMTVKERNKVNGFALKTVNNTMKKIGDILEFKAKVTSMVARHTWATIMMRKKVPALYISKGLGHTSISTTEKYLADFDQDQKKEIGALVSSIITDDNLETEIDSDVWDYGPHKTPKE